MCIRRPRMKPPFISNVEEHNFQYRRDAQNRRSSKMAVSIFLKFIAFTTQIIAVIFCNYFFEILLQTGVEMHSAKFNCIPKISWKIFIFYK